MVAVRVESREWYVSRYAPEGIPTSDHLKLRTRTVSLALASIPDNHVALEILWLSVDPYLPSKLTGRQDGLYFSQFKPGQVIQGFGIGRVIRSRNMEYGEDDIVNIDEFCPFAEYCVIPPIALRKIHLTSGIALPDYLNSIGKLILQYAPRP